MERDDKEKVERIRRSEKSTEQKHSVFRGRAYWISHRYREREGERERERERGGGERANRES